ncbi:MAG: hypothetical protein AAF226_08570, partial [Verrucomicrobiota bacterium]
EDFKTEVTGIAAGVLWHQDKVYATVAPDVWALSDSDNNGIADEREVISTGYGLHIAYAGHDMHGLTVGPDGRIYWSIGDKGLSVTDKNGKKWHHPNQGAVMRCEPDGSNFEVFAWGLRNVQELAFDEYGNLFGVDNDADQPGEKERFIHIVKGMDAGWRCNYQYRGEGYNPWTAERLWEPEHEGRPAYALPPISNYHDGPCGFVYNPGTALGKGWERTFFLTGAPRGDQWAFQVENKGASFEMVNSRSIGKGTALIGWNFGPDGGLYGVDWANGYPLNQKGAIWKLDVETPNPIREETAQWIATDFSTLDLIDLDLLLGHADQRVRLKAQFELVAREEADLLLSRAETYLRRDRPKRPEGRLSITQQTSNGGLWDRGVFGQIHAIWGVGQLMRHNKITSDQFNTLLSKAHVESYSDASLQLLKIIGEVDGIDPEILRRHLYDNRDNQNTFYALLASKKHINEDNIDLIVHRIAGTSSPYLRHAVSEALTNVPVERIVDLLRSHEKKQVAGVVALRRMQNPRVAEFLKSRHVSVTTEAALAIHDDFSIPDAMPDLAAALFHETNKTDAYVLRALNANARLGTAECVSRVAEFASKNTASESQRLFAIERLAEWLTPPALDAVTGRARTAPQPIPLEEVKRALKPYMTLLIGASSTAVQEAGMKLSDQYDLPPDNDSLTNLIEDETIDPAVRVVALEMIEGDTEALTAMIDPLLKSDHTSLRVAALKKLAKVDPDEGKWQAQEWIRVENPDYLAEVQAAIHVLGDIGDKETISRYLDYMLDGGLMRGTHMDILKAAESLEVENDRLAAFHAARANPMDPKSFDICLEGGDAAKGKDIFFNHLAAQCVRCHKYEKGGKGSVIGPNLYGYGVNKSPEELMEALVAPQATIAKGYGNTSVTLKDGKTVSGTLKKDDKAKVVVQNATSGES